MHAMGAPEAHLAAVEVSVLRIIVDDSVLVDNRHPYINPSRWKPLLMSIWSVTA